MSERLRCPGLRQPSADVFCSAAGSDHGDSYDIKVVRGGGSLKNPIELQIQEKLQMHESDGWCES